MNTSLSLVEILGIKIVDFFESMIYFYSATLMISLFQISGLEKECRDSQRKLFDIQRERDEASSQLRKLEAERNELRKRVNEVCF